MSERQFAVVTGASSGIGYELAKQFAEHGFDLLVTAEDPAIEQAAADPASDLQDAADEREEVAVAAAWPPQDRELMSRERIEAEGFAFVAPEISSPLDELGDAWSRNGNGADHAGEDVRPR